MSWNNLWSKTVTASGLIAPTDPPLTPIPAPPALTKGWGGRLHAVHGDCTGAGLLDFYDGYDVTGKLILSVPMAVGWVNFDPHGSHRFIYGVYAEFNGVAGAFAVTFS